MSAIRYLQQRAAAFGGKATIVGKGPSFAEMDREGRHSGRLVVGLNETSLHTRCDVAFLIDEDILDKSGAAIADSGIDALITPRVPHRPTKRIGGLTIYGPSDRPAEAAPWYPRFEGRWHGFNLGTAEAQQAFGPVIAPGNFSAPIVATLLAQAGFTDILLAGVDGGVAYAGAFADVEYKKLRSVQSDFDTQFKELRAVRDQYGVDFRSVRCSEPHILIGTEAEQCLATEVLKWSIESNTFLTVRYCEADSTSRVLFTQGATGTPFSLQRLFLPEMAGHQGRGVYFDSDMLVFKDVYELFNHDMRGDVLMGCEPTPGRRTQFSVFLVDNERASWDARELVASYQAGRISYDALMKDFVFAQPRSSRLPQAWNALEFFEPGVTANIHFTDMGTQPWLSIYNPNADLWCEALFKAVDARPAVAQALQESVDRGWVRPSLRWQVEQRRADPWTMPAHVKALDAAWLPPHARLRFPDAAPRTQLLKWRMASRLRRAMQSRSYVRLMRAGHALRKVF